MALKYYCDLCNKEIAPPSPINARSIATVEFIDSTTGKQTASMCCRDCAAKLKEFMEKIKGENKIVNLGKDLTMKIKPN